MLYGPYTQKEIDRITAILKQHSVLFEVVVDAEINNKYLTQTTFQNKQYPSRPAIGHTQCLRIEEDQWHRIPGVAQANLTEFNVIPEITEIPEGVELGAEYIPPIKNSANKWTAIGAGIILLFFLYNLFQGKVTRLR